jgi:hypothetical protein
MLDAPVLSCCHLRSVHAGPAAVLPPNHHGPPTWCQSARGTLSCTSCCSMLALSVTLATHWPHTGLTWARLGEAGGGAVAPTPHRLTGVGATRLCSIAGAARHRSHYEVWGGEGWICHACSLEAQWCPHRLHDTGVPAGGGQGRGQGSITAPGMQQHSMGYLCSSTHTYSDPPHRACWDWTAPDTHVRHDSQLQRAR